MNGKVYQDYAMRTNDGNSTQRVSRKIESVALSERVIDVGGVLNGCLGLSGEVGEFNDMVKKWIFHEKPLDEIHAQKEIGDVLWYIALICHSFGWNMDIIMQQNIAKLRSRYPEGFDVVKSANRKEGDV